MTEEYASMTVAQLKELLKEQGLPVSGKKAELIERLMEASGADEKKSSKKQQLKKRLRKTISLKKMKTGMTTKMKVTSLSKSQFSMKQHKKHFRCVLPRRRRHHRLDEPNGSVTSDCLVLDGEHLTVWTVSNEETTDTVVHSYVLAMERSLKLVGSTHQASVK